MSPGVEPKHERMYQTHHEKRIIRRGARGKHVNTHGRPIDEIE